MKTRDDLLQAFSISRDAYAQAWAGQDKILTHVGLLLAEGVTDPNEAILLIWSLGYATATKDILTKERQAQETN